MATFIKSGFWMRMCNPCNGYRGWLNLDQLITSIAGPGTPGPIGPQGPEGPQGIQGIKGDQGEQGVQGVQGVTGDTGPQGTAGNSITLLGSVADYAAFLAGPGSVPGANIGDAWILLSDGSLYSWNGTVWFDAGDIKGPQGDQGVQGPQGIQGEQGIPGIQGEQGVQGIQGIQGPAGLTGFFAQTADSAPVVNTALETTIVGPGVGGLTVPANGFQIGDSFSCLLDGLVTCGSAATLHIRVRTTTGVLLADTDIIDMSASTGQPWIMNLYFTIRTLGGAGTASVSSGGLFSYIRNGGVQFEGYVLSTLNATTFDTTVSNTLVVTAQWDPASIGSSIISRNFTLTKVY